MQKLLVTVGFPIASVVVALLLLEAMLQVLSPYVAFEPAPEHRLCGDCSYLYEPIPGEGKANALGLNGPEISLEKRGDSSRIVVLGDSVTHGAGVPESFTYPRVLERLLREKFPTRSIEVVNAGVRGYSTYNQVRLLRDKLLQLDPDLVILQTCMNDIANPRWHWNAVSRIEFVPPRDAFPRPEEMNTPYAGGIAGKGLLFRSALYSIWQRAYTRLWHIETRERSGVNISGRTWPTYITAESNATLEPLTRYDSPEWQWLRKQLDVGREVSTARGILFMLLVVPLAYELQVGYPLDPEAGFLRYCADHAVTCINLREEFSAHAPHELYVYWGYSKPSGDPDVWHLNRRGHEAAAAAIAKRIKIEHLLRWREFGGDPRGIEVFAETAR